MAKKEIDFDEELQKIARKANVQIKKSEYLYDRQFKKLDLEIDTVLNDKVKELIDVNEMRREYTNIDFDNSLVEMYRKKLKRI